MKDKKSWIGDLLIILAIFAVVALGLGGPYYLTIRSDSKSNTKHDEQEKARLARPIVDLRNGYVKINEMDCQPALKGYSKKQLSELTDTEKWLAKDATECGVTFRNVRVPKDRIRGYYPHFSIVLWMNDKDPRGIDGPVHIQKVNVENCEMVVKTIGDLTKTVVIEGKCSLLDEALP